MHFVFLGDTPMAGAQISSLRSNSSALDFSNWLAYRSPVYYQGALFLNALREEIGDESFFSLIRRYLATYRYRFATTKDFLRLAEAVSCCDLNKAL